MWHSGVARAFLLRIVKDSVEGGGSGGPPPSNFECVSQICASLVNFKHKTLSRAWCKTIVTSYIKWGSYNSFALSPRYSFWPSFLKSSQNGKSQLEW